MSDLEFDAHDFFVLRSPLLPVDALLAWYAGEDPPCRRSQVLQSALAVASPSLARAAASGREREQSRVEETGDRYFVRAASRSAPFGLFSGVSVGRIGERTKICFAPSTEYLVRARADGRVLAHLWRLLEARACRGNVRLACNETLFRVGRWYRYLAIDRTAREPRCASTTIVRDPILDRLIEAVAEPRAIDELASLVSSWAAVDHAEAHSYVVELVERGLLRVHDLPSPDDPSALDTARTGLASDEEMERRIGDYAEALAELQRPLRQLMPDDLRLVAAGARAIMPETDHAGVNIVMVKPGQFEIGRDVIESIRGAIDFLRRSARPSELPTLRNFKEQFAARFEGATVPLLEALDPDVGIPFEDAPLDETADDILRPLRSEADSEPEPLPVGAREQRLLQLIRSMPAGAREIVLGRDDVEALASYDLLPLPESFNVLCALGERSDGKFDVFLGGAGGPPGVRLMTRFAFASDELDACLRTAIVAEETGLAPAVLAEIVHLPARAEHWNVSTRPMARRVELPLLGIPGGTARIALRSLFVSMINDRIVITTAEGREIKPRLTSGHNPYHLSNPQVYKFLAAVQSQEAPMPLEWSWGGLGFETFLPRVRLGSVVLARARWRLTEKEIPKECSGEEIAGRLMRAGVPPIVELAGLIIDLRSPRSHALLRRVRKENATLVATECFPSPSHLAAKGPEGRYLCELDIPFRRLRRADATGDTPQAVVTVQRHFFPGDEWLFAGLYCAPRLSDDLLGMFVAPFTATLRAEYGVDRWFFVRYADPHFHLRIRFRKRGADASVLTAALRRALQAKDLDRFVHRLIIDTYVREVERYGGDEGIDIAEAIFHADSETTLEAIAESRIETFADQLAYATLAVEQMLLLADDDGLDAPAAAGQWIEMMKRRAKLSARDPRPQLALAYRKNDERIRRNGFEKLLARRQERIEPLATRLLESCRTGRLAKPLPELLFSYCHMSVNRIFTQPSPLQELLVYDSVRKRRLSARARAHDLA